MRVAPLIRGCLDDERAHGVVASSLCLVSGLQALGEVGPVDLTRASVGMGCRGVATPRVISAVGFASEVVAVVAFFSLPLLTFSFALLTSTGIDVVIRTFRAGAIVGRGTTVVFVAILVEV